MTISSTTSRVSHNGNGSTTAFAFAYYFLADADLEVRSVAADGTETVKTLTTHYTVSGAGDPSGGTVTMLVAPASGTKLVIRRLVTLTQATDYTANDPFPAQSHEDALDKRAMAEQQIQEQLDRAIKAPVGDASPSMTLPAAVDRASKVLAFDADGDVVVSTEDLADIEDSITESAASAAAAAASASAAATSASAASTSASAASSSASAASTSASAASTSASSASTSASSASTSATNAATSATNAAASAASLSNPAAGNPIINGEFRLWQRGTSVASVADDVYHADRWYALNQSNPTSAARTAGSPYYGLFTQANASAQRFGTAQIIEGKNCKHLRGKTVTFYGELAVSSTPQAIRFVVLEWTGTEDAVTSDVVNDWTSSTYTAGNFFLGSSLTITQAPGTFTNSGAGAVERFSTTLTLGSAFNNLVVFVWIEGAAVQNYAFALFNVGLCLGSAAPVVHVPRQWTLEHQLCRRYYYKSFLEATTPAQSVGQTSGEHCFPQQTAASTSGRHQSPAFPVEMFATPTITFYNPVSANALAYNANTATDFSATSAGNTNRHGFSLSATPPAASSVGNLCIIHFTAAAEL